MSRDTKFFIKFWSLWLFACFIGFIASFLLVNWLMGVI